MPRTNQFRPQWSFRRSARTEGFLEGYEQFGVLYGEAFDDAEAERIRELCAEKLIPMGYGRVGRIPTVLEDDYVIELFTRHRM